jgi:hypothetical protein
MTSIHTYNAWQAMIVLKVVLNEDPSSRLSVTCEAESFIPTHDERHHLDEIMGFFSRYQERDNAEE